MSRVQLLQSVIGVTLVILSLVGCSTPALTLTLEAPVATPTPVLRTATPEPPIVTPTPEPPTPILPTATSVPPTSATTSEVTTGTVQGQLTFAGSQLPPTQVVLVRIRLGFVINEEYSLPPAGIDLRYDSVVTEEVLREEGVKFEIAGVPPGLYRVVWAKQVIKETGGQYEPTFSFLMDSEDNFIQFEVVPGQTVDLGQVLVTEE